MPRTYAVPKVNVLAHTILIGITAANTLIARQTAIARTQTAIDFATIQVNQNEHDPFQLTSRKNLLECICPQTYYEDPESDLCVPRVSGGACVSTDDCQMANDPNTHCIEQRCRCVAGHRLHHRLFGQCEQINLKVAGVGWLPIMSFSFANFGFLLVCCYITVQKCRNKKL